MHTYIPLTHLPFPGGLLCLPAGLPDCRKLGAGCWVPAPNDNHDFTSPLWPSLALAVNSAYAFEAFLSFRTSRLVAWVGQLVKATPHVNERHDDEGDDDDDDDDDEEE
ncbi:hypothetical protein LX36DRAFT_668671 [Colletotrichum falcatum]|nr:hypothetical protein LX36DRAFT_668671 [Colletotrichum falcatum]